MIGFALTASKVSSGVTSRFHVVVAANAEGSRSIVPCTADAAACTPNSTTSDLSSAFQKGCYCIL